MSKEPKFDFAVDSKLRHGALFRIASRFGSIVSLAREIGAPQQSVYKWVGLRAYPSPAWWNKNFEIAAKVEHLTGMTYEELWPDSMRLQIDSKILTRDTIYKRMDVAALSYQQNRTRRLEQSQDGRTFDGSRPDIDLIRELLSQLTERERMIIELRLIQDLSQGVVAEKFGVTRHRIHQLEIKALRKMREYAEKKNWNFELIADLK